MKGTKEQKSKHKIPNTNKGITLIALVITIIVMLILVAVTISMAVNGGLFDYAGKAVGETQNAIKLEQQLANGKIQVNGKWYASIEDYINNNPIKTGIEITPKTINLKKKETTDVEGEEKLTETITATISGMEEEPTITWEASGDAITLSGTTGKSIVVTAVGGENATVTVTAKCTYDGLEYSQSCEVIVQILKKPLEIARGDFVKYDVEYQDVHKNYNYTNTTGWRLLNYEIDEEEGTIYNVELVSTGVPASFQYYYTPYNETGNNKWWITNEDKISEFKTALQGHYKNGIQEYTFSSNTGVNVYAAAGMYYNFENIPFYGPGVITNTGAESARNVGWYKNITKNGKAITGTLASDVFLTSDDYNLRTLTLPEINNDGGETSIVSMNKITIEPADGLYVLNNISKITNLSSYTYENASGNAYYWLASPKEDNYWSLYYLDFKGGVSSFDSIIAGIRPVVSFEEGVKYTVDYDTDVDTGIEYLILTPVN